MKIFSWIIKDTSIDFSGGVLIEVKSKNGPIDVDKVRNELDTLNLDELNLQSFGDARDELMIRAQANNADEESQRLAVKQIKEMLDNDFTFERIESVGPQVGDELKLSGVLASVFAMMAISLYIWFRFEWKFAVGALIGLFHDLIITVGLVSIFHLDFSLTTIAAILTLAGYSVNDTVVTYDRVRENLQKYKKMPQYDLLNKSVNDIFSRTILTGITTFLASVALLVFGGDALRSFAFVITVGILIGTFSSIFICVPVINIFDLRATPDEKDVNPFGNVQ